MGSTSYVFWDDGGLRRRCGVPVEGRVPSSTCCSSFGKLTDQTDWFSSESTSSINLMDSDTMSHVELPVRV